MRPDTLLFDMDGVLVDVANSYRAAIKKTVEFFLKRNIPMQEIQDYKNLGGYNNDWDLTEALLLAKNIPVQKSLIVEKFQEIYRGTNFNGLITNEEWLMNAELLRKLSVRYHIGIVTGRLREEAELAINKANASSLIHGMITYDDLPKDKQKPDPEGIRMLMLKFNSKNAIYFGDSVDDMQMAKAAGITAIGVLPPDADGKLAGLLEENGADKVICSINKIEEVLR